MKSSRKKWSYREIFTLKKHFSDMPQEKLLELLPHRSWTAIYQMGKKLGLERTKRFLKEHQFQKGQKPRGLRHTSD